MFVPSALRATGRLSGNDSHLRGSSLTAVACHRRKTPRVKALKLNLSPRDLGRGNTGARKGHECFK